LAVVQEFAGGDGPKPEAARVPDFHCLRHDLHRPALHGGFALQPTGHSYTSPEHWKAVGNSFYQTGPVNSDAQSFQSQNSGYQALTRARPLALGYFAVMYFVSMFVATFLNVAFYQQILNALNGQPVSMMGGIQFAGSKWKAILMWTLFAGVVGISSRAWSNASA